MRGLLAAALLVLASTTPVDGHASAPSGIPVHATFRVQQGRDDAQPTAVGAVHGVRRIPGATVLYFSLGFPVRYGSGVSFFSLARRVQTDDRWGVRAGWPTQYVVDPVGRLAYTALVTEDDGDCLCSPPRATRNESGTMFVLYEVLPELPPEVRAVDVVLGFDTVVRGVPVEVGRLTPERPADGPVVLGEGWPRVDQAAVDRAPEKQRSVYPLQTTVSDLEQKVTTVETPGTVSLELATDVLFDFDSATLRAEAHDTIARVAETVNARAAAGQIGIVGHTDSSGSDAYNDELSRARADAVRAALEPLLRVPGVQLRAEGRGEREPVEDNATEAGRQRNRRVAIVFEPKADR